MDDLEILQALGVDPKVEKKKTLSKEQERVIAGFEEIQAFYEENQRVPEHKEDRDIFERLYAERLDRLRENPKFKELLADMDQYGLLDQPEGFEEVAEDDDQELLAQLGVEVTATETDVSVLRHVRSAEERKAAEFIARRQKAEDFDQFEPLFETVQAEIENGIRGTKRFQRDVQIRRGEFFILFGQKLYIAEIGNEFINDDGRTDQRLRVIFENGVESNMLLRSLQKQLWKDERGRRIYFKRAKKVNLEQEDLSETQDGTIYVLESLSEQPEIKSQKELIHKIGVTGGKVETRIANAENDPTFLMSKVEIVATYKLSKINRVKLENLLHKIFQPARLNMTMQNEFGKKVSPKEWFLVPLYIIEEAIEKIKDGSIIDYKYDPITCRFVPIG